jgi:hypothetical protein
MEEKLPSNPNIQREGKNFVVKDVPFVGDMVFVPAIIQWQGIVDNPFFKDKKFKTVRYYLKKESESRESKDKNTVVLKELFRQYPDILSVEVLDMPLGMFAKYLKENHPDIQLKVGRKEFPVDKLLVNPSGGEEYYVSFQVENMTSEKGLYLWVIDGTPEYVGIASSPQGLDGRINQEYGNITPYKCSRDGQSQTCRSNISIRDKYQQGNVVSLYISPVKVDSLKENPEFMEYMDTLGFKKTREDKNILEVLEKYIISSGDFKDSGWNRRT